MNAPAVNPQLQRLRAEIRFDREAFSQRIRELGAVNLDSSEPAQHALAAVALHHAYGSIEGLSERIARRIDGDVPQGPEWHQELLHAMGLSVDGVRPSLFGQGSVAALRELLGFRHFFRHAYAVELDPERLQALRGRILQAAPKILDEIDAFDAFLAAVARCDD